MSDYPSLVVIGTGTESVNQRIGEIKRWLGGYPDDTVRLIDSEENILGYAKLKDIEQMQIDCSLNAYVKGLVEKCVQDIDALKREDESKELRYLEHGNYRSGRDKRRERRRNERKNKR